MRYRYIAAQEKKGDLEKFVDKYEDYISKVIKHKGGTTSLLLKKNPDV